MKVLLMTAMYPTRENPAFGAFVQAQAESLRQAGVEIEVLVLQGRFRKLIYPKGVLQLRRRLAAGAFDLVHAHYSYVGMVARTQRRVPVVVTFHGSDLLGPVGEQGKKGRCSNLITAAGQRLARYVDAAIVQSAEMASKLEQSNVFIVPCEVNFQLFQPANKQQARAALGLAADKKYLLFAASPQNAVKRFPLAKEVAEQLAAEDPSVELLVVFQETQERLALYMSACDALVFPSYQEGSPNIVKQAMACNLPIVATDVGDVRQVIGRTKGCYICDPDVAEFAARFREILAHPMRTDGREQIRDLDSSTVARRILAIYEDVVRRREVHAADRVQANLYGAGR
jgi:glycosyltransferase involved in cell wall biosynthesis